MEIQSTYTIQRNLALQIIKNKIDDCSNEELAAMLECFEKESEFRNYEVVKWIPESPIARNEFGYHRVIEGEDEF